jgi:hypothetical protein
MPRPRVQFCPQGHDTFAVGRNDSGCCRTCANARPQEWKKRSENREHVRKQEKERAERRRREDEIVAFKFHGHVKGWMAMAVREECARRGGVHPAELVRRILRTVIEEKLFTAVLDE